MRSLAADLRYALRTLRRNPGFAAVAIAALALGIGANTAIFTVVNAVLLQPLPYHQPDRIVKLGREFRGQVGYSNSVPKYMAWRQAQSFEAMTLYDFIALAMNLGAGTPPQQVSGVHVSADYFKVFGVSPMLGRTFLPSEDLPGGQVVAVISHSLWQSRLAENRDVLGQPILVNGAPIVVVGILPPAFHPDPEAELWLPLQADPNSTNHGHYLNVAGRLKPGVTLDAARAELKVIGEQFRKANPKWMDAAEGVGVVPMRDAVTGDVRLPLLILFGAVAVVLLIACANVANLLLARAAGRQRELGIRAAIGAGRWRIARQLLTESVLLAACGGLLGLAVGKWGVEGLLLFAPGNIPRLAAADGTVAVPPLDWRIVLFTLAVSILTGVLFGILPALHASSLDLSSTLNEGSGRSGTGGRHKRVRSALVVAEMALALVLLIGATLLIRSFVGLRTVNSGIDARNVFTFQTSLAGGVYPTTAKVDNLVTQVARRLEALPEVEAAAAAIALPVEFGIDLPFSIVGKTPARGDYAGDEQWRSVSPRYFQTFRIPLLRGRTFTEAETAQSTRVVIINEAMAKKYWSQEDPLGQTMIIGKGLGPQFEDPPRQVVGIVGNVRENGLANEGVGVMYIPQGQVPEGLTALANNVIPLSWAVRTRTDPLALRAAVERELHAVDGQMPVSRERTMEDVISRTVARQNFNMVLLSIFAAIALLLATIGIYGLMSYSVQQRTQEIGIRMALGADRKRTLMLVLKEAVWLVAAGVVLGLGLGYGAGRLLGSLLFGVKATDAVTFALVAGILTAVALIAAYVPARRATALDPTVALRVS